MRHEKEYHIDVDIIIDNFVLKYPHLRPPTRKSIAKLINTFPQILSDWKYVRTPRFAYFLINLMKLGKIPLKSFIVRRKGKWVVDIYLFIKEVNKLESNELHYIDIDDVINETEYPLQVLNNWIKIKSPNLAYKILKLEELAEDDFTTFIVEKQININNYEN